MMSIKNETIHYVKLYYFIYNFRYYTEKFNYISVVFTDQS